MLTRAQAIAVAGMPQAELEVLGRAARQIRDSHWGNTVTYSRKVFVPLTTMCRDSCAYCTFVQQPGTAGAKVMTPVQVMDSVRQGERLGCKEVLFSLGEKPELRYQQARDALASLGHKSMTGYLHSMCERVLEDSDMLPHVNAGTLSEAELRLLKPVSVSMGMMLETVSRRLTQRGQAHYACPDKVPIQRLRTLERAGRLDVPFTTGILIGIGETWEERIDTLLAIQQLHLSHGHIQEVIVQNFRAKPGTAMAQHIEPSLDDMVRTLVVARLLLDPSISIQAPPNLQERYATYLAAGINDWGGVSPATIDYINPERAWPQIGALRRATEASGLKLAERLAIYPQFQRQPQRYLEPRIAERVNSLCREDGLPREQCLS